MKNWDKYRRMQCNIQKAIPNQQVSALMEKHYSLLHQELITAPEDEDIFSDTFLKLTYNFNPDMLFADQFHYYFQLLKGAYIRDSRSCQFLPIEEGLVADED